MLLKLYVFLTLIIIDENSFNIKKKKKFIL